MDRAARQLKALADPVRLHLLQILAQVHGTLCVSEVVKRCTLTQPTISWHLRILREVGLVGVTKQGRYAYYHVKAETLAQVRHQLLLLEQETQRVLENPS
ncbi:hypothetical protein KSX_66480 [Ktedonospora formicarum]|uniref:HTH arsR-type domain-containing protein n=2 Tax=Ktedonospora formicarum TaxID=2778364 RepID=A0A8J3MXE7_9CHLR|nr:hypothetical protein KSX_66480 [Ktedonospora formicarum]